MKKIAATYLTLCCLCVPSFAQTQNLADRFARLDKNADGKLSPDELRAPKFFERFDRDGDGSLSLDEVVAFRSGSTPKSAPSPQSADTSFKPRPHSKEARRAGLDSQDLEMIDVAMQDSVDKMDVAGVVALISRNGVRGYFEAFGKLDLETGTPMPLDAIFRLKSMSKPIVTVAALILFDEGAFTLDEPIADHLPEWSEPRVLQDGGTVPAKRPITPRMLMSHSSGLYYNLPGKAPFSGMPPRDEKTTLADYSKALAAQPLKFHPGDSYTYGTSIDVLGRYIEAVSGQPLDEFLDERVFAPLKMVDTGFWAPEEKADRLAQLYRRVSPGNLAVAQEAFPITDKPSLFMGGGGLCGTTADYERFCLMLLGGGELNDFRILKPGTVDLIFENHLRFQGDKTYGLGGAVDGKGGYSWGGANGTKFWVNREKNTCAVFMVQTQRYRAPTYNRFQPLAMEALENARRLPDLPAPKRDIPYGDLKAQRLDLYVPQKAKHAPVMLYVHGGGWRFGDKRAVGKKASFFNSQGWVFASMNYRLLPGGEHPKNVEDVAAAITWIHDHVAEHGGDPDMIFIMGHSAGCHLVSLVATDGRRLEDAGNSLNLVKGVIALDTQAYDVPALVEKSSSKLYLGVFGEDPKVQRDASPIHHVAEGKGIPPFLVLYSSGIGLRPNPNRPLAANAFAEALIKAAIPAQVIDASDRNHGQINSRFGDPQDEKVTGAAMEFLDGILAAP